MNPAKFSGFLLINLLVCIWIGWMLDKWTGKSPLFLILLILYAIIGSFILLIRKKKK